MIILCWRAAVWGILTLYAAGALAQDGFAVEWLSDTADSNRVVIEVAGLKKGHLDQLRAANWRVAEWQELLAVYAEQGDPLRDPWLPPMLGKYSIEAGAIRFTPQFPLQRGVVYRAIFRPKQLLSSAGKLAVVSSTFRLALPAPSPTTVVSAVYPTSDTLPENLLKFYLHFSAPMSRGRIYEHIHLYDEKSREVELPFLEIDEELWDSAMTRLTLFIDPGRIKREVKPLEEIGPALEAGKRFVLVIDKGWTDAAGNPLKESFRKEFRVVAPDREPPDPSRWKVFVPAAGTREKLKVRFSEPMDDALARRLMSVRTSGAIVDGSTGLGDGETSWEFVPLQPWAPGKHELLIQTTIEDLAGNNIGKPFEVDLFEGVQRRLTNATVSVSFHVK